MAQDECLWGLKLCVACNKQKVYTVVELCDMLVKIIIIKKKKPGRINVNRKKMCIFQCSVCGMLGLVVVKQCVLSASLSAVQEN